MSHYRNPPGIFSKVVHSAFGVIFILANNISLIIVVLPWGQVGKDISSPTDSDTKRKKNQRDVIICGAEIFYYNNFLFLNNCYVLENYYDLLFEFGLLSLLSVNPYLILMCGDSFFTTKRFNDVFPEDTVSRCIL